MNDGEKIADFGVPVSTCRFRWCGDGGSVVVLLVPVAVEIDLVVELPSVSEVGLDTMYEKSVCT